MSKRILILLFFIFCFANEMLPFDKKIDSLLIKVRTEANQSMKSKLLFKIGILLEKTGSDSAEHYLSDALASSILSKDYRAEAEILSYLCNYFTNKGEYSKAEVYAIKATEKYSSLLRSNINNKTIENEAADFYSNAGTMYDFYGKYDLAITYHKKALHLAIKTGNKHHQSVSNNNIGIVYEILGNNTEALIHYMKALNLNEQSHNRISLSRSYINIGNIHYNMRNYKLAMSYFNKSLEIKEELNDTVGIARCLNNIGSTYRELFQNELALQYFKRSLILRDKVKDIKGVSTCYNNLGIIYRALDSISKAIDCYKKCLAIDSALNDKYAMAIIYGNIAALHNIERKYHLAIEYSLKSLNLARELNLTEEKKYVYEHLGDAYEGLQNFKEALYYNKLFKQISDSIVDENRNETINDLEAKYQTSKKQQEIESQKSKLLLQKTEIKQQAFQKWTFVAGFIFSLLMGLIIFRYYWLKKKANILLAIQKDEIKESRDVVVKQKEQIEELFTELKDSINYAVRIQQAIMPSDSGLPVFESFIFFQPKNVVSGDFYYYRKIENKLFFTVADCTGHGVPGALMSVLGISFLNEELAKHKHLKAGQILDKLRDYIINTLQQRQSTISSEEQQSVLKDGMDMAICELDVNSLELNFAGAKNSCFVATSNIETINQCQNYTLHFSPCEINNDSIKSKTTESEAALIELKGDKQPVGVHEMHSPFSTKSVFLNHCDVIFLMSDGYEDQFGGPKFKKFMQKNLVSLIVKNCNKSMTMQKELLCNSFNEWMGNNEQTDDVTVLGVKV